MHIAMLSPITWRTPPRNYGPWDSVVSLLTEGLVNKGIEVTLFATKDSKTQGHLIGLSPRGYEEDKELLPKILERLHIFELFEKRDDFNLIALGCKGEHSKLRRILLGTVATNLLNEASCDVLFVR